MPARQTHAHGSYTIFEAIWTHLGGSPFVREYRFHPERRWRFDYAWPEARVAFEIEGGVFAYGRHNRPVGFIQDIEKYNEAAFSGWVIIRATPDMLNDLVFLNRLVHFVRERMHALEGKDAAAAREEAG